tara:strand:- start:1361 stop:1537 length:177 start_codon:yes stop_codon:yes gene_type:complete
MDILIGIFGVLFALAVCWIVIMGSIIADEDKRARRAAHKAGTHDYYGNKLSRGEDNDQ